MAVAHSPAAACGTLPEQHQQPPTEPNQKQLMYMQFRGTYSCMQKCVFSLYLLSKAAICSGRKRKEYRVPQKIQVGLKTWYT